MMMHSVVRAASLPRFHSQLKQVLRMYFVSVPSVMVELVQVPSTSLAYRMNPVHAASVSASALMA
ncbi:MAG: hypothetical protein NZ789_13720, partial [Pseudomonadales bacterium]|nr:hypothetical protein [Pseudomonadales bacterium]